MRIKRTHLTHEERCIIFGLKASNFSLRRIAKQIGVSVSTISREFARNTYRGSYKPKQASIYITIDAKRNHQEHSRHISELR